MSQERPAAEELARARGLASQRSALSRALASGMPRLGWKIGLNVPALQARFGLDAPLVGWLEGRRVLASGAEYPVREGQRIHVESELALRFRQPVPPDASPEAARRAIGEIAPALELVDYALPRADLEAIVSHSMFHEATVLGPGAAPETPLPAGRPLLLVGGQVRATPQEGWVPRDLAQAAALAARRLAEIGEALQAGDVLLSGSYTTPFPLAPGDTATADFGALGVVSVTLAR
jgi:2-oxo-hept-3-ene-1,7-dioate hydratase